MERYKKAFKILVNLMDIGIFQDEETNNYGILTNWYDYFYVNREDVELIEELILEGMKEENEEA